MISTAVKPSLSLFCRQGFERINTLPLAGGSGASTSLSTLPTQGRLRLHTALRPRPGPMHRIAGSVICFVHRPELPNGVRLCTTAGLHGNRVGITMPLESALSPQAQAKPGFPPAPTRNWAYQAGTRGFIGVPFRGFLAPPSETDDLTRILRRRLAPYSISQI